MRPEYVLLGAMVSELLEQIDHDIAKDYNVETAEEPEVAEENMQGLVNTVERHIGNVTTERGD